MSKNSFLYFLVLLLLLSCSRQKFLQYISVEKPSLIPKKFAPGTISLDSMYEYGSVFNTDGTEFFYAVDLGGRAEIKTSKLEKGIWTSSKTIISDASYSFNDPFLNPTEDKLYYISNMPRNEQDTIEDYDIWFSNRTQDGWSAPINAGASINTDHNEYYISFTNDGSMYFASNKDAGAKRKHDFDIYKSPLKNGVFQKPIRQGGGINTRAYEADVFIAPDESYIIFCSFRKTGLGKGDLYISFKNEQGVWSEAISMEKGINTAGHELCPFVSKDGKYFFYTSNEDIYWVNTKIISYLKQKSLR